MKSERAKQIIDSKKSMEGNKDAKLRQQSGQKNANKPKN
ncbi:hypothetical protein EXM96_15385 [Clostridium botulinum]|nr:hypothetical protein [Clostridium botulinum]